MTINSFNSKVTLSSAQIIALSIDGLDSDDEDDGYDSFDISSHYGDFRWTDITKFADMLPLPIDRRPFVDRLVREDKLPCYSTESGERISLLLNSPTNSPRSGMTGTFNNQVVGKTNDDYVREDKLPCHSTELGERISLLLNSPTNSPRSGMTDIFNNQVVGRKTLKKSINIDIDDDISLEPDESDIYFASPNWFPLQF